MTARGLVIVVGGTGSGKSTTLAAMIGYEDAVRFADSTNDLRLRIKLEPGGRKPPHERDESDIHIV